MRLPDAILRTACFLSAVTGRAKYGATGFIFAVRGKYDNAYLHLVTAKHVADKLDGAPFLVGINGRDGKKIEIPADDVQWFHHPTEPNAVDAAVTMIAPSNYDHLDLDWIDEDSMVTASNRHELGVGIGDEIAIIGLFTRFHGKDTLFPIARIGNLAMLPSERIPVLDFDPMDAYLAEARSLGGLSGSPVFVRQTINIQRLKDGHGQPIPAAASGRIYFLGLMHGHWQVPVEAMRAQGVEAVEAVNMGVSIIVPADKIREIIYHPELVKMRDEADREIAKEVAPVQDSELGESEEKSFTQADFEGVLRKVTRKRE